MQCTITFRPRSAEDNGLAIVQQHAVLHMPVHGARKDHRFDVAADARHLLGPEAVVDPLHRLLDDRPGIEIGDDDGRWRRSA